MKDIINEIDSVLRKLITEEKIKLYSRWSREYKDRIIYLTKNRRLKQGNLPTQNTDNPGFEKNLISLLFAEIQDKDAYCEWPYASYINQSRESADIVFFESIDGVPFEIWMELGMFASQEEKKYKHDLEKVKSIVDINAFCIGVSAHFEIFPKGKVINIYNSFAEENALTNFINIRTIRNKSNIHIVRLIVANINAISGDML